MGRSDKKKEPKSDGTQLVAANRKARFRYHIDDCVEVGMVLSGTEVKAAREGSVNLTDSFAKIRRGEVFLVGCHFGHYAAAGPAGHAAVRERKLLLHRREIDRLEGKTRERGQTLIVTKLYFRDGRLKAELAVAKGKKDHDKRATIKERAMKKEVERAMKHRSR